MPLLRSHYEQHEMGVGGGRLLTADNGCVLNMTARGLGGGYNLPPISSTQKDDVLAG
jgi:hypothetical protein